MFLKAFWCVDAGMGACAAAWKVLEGLVQGFIYKEWNHALND